MVNRPYRTVATCSALVRARLAERHAGGHHDRIAVLCEALAGGHARRPGDRLAHRMHVRRTTGCTPQTTASRRAVAWCGRQADDRRVRPLARDAQRGGAGGGEGARSPAAPIVCATCARRARRSHPAAERSGSGARGVDASARQPGPAPPARRCGPSCSPPRTDTGPAAVSADSITASAPSNTAVATSDASARVGAGALIMLSSICVATTTGLPSWRAARTMRFCAQRHLLGRQFHAEVAARHHHRVGQRAGCASRLSSACGFSSFTMIQALPPVSAWPPPRPPAAARRTGRCSRRRAPARRPGRRGPSRSAPGSAAPRRAR